MLILSFIFSLLFFFCFSKFFPLFLLHFPFLKFFSKQKLKQKKNMEMDSDSDINYDAAWTSRDGNGLAHGSIFDSFYTKF